MILQGKKILVGVTGSIAVYKAVVLVRLLIKAGAEVQVLMTENATKFVSPLTFSVLSKRPVYQSVTSEHGWNNHVELGLWADAFVVAPATATTLAKMSIGLADNMIVASYLSARCPVFFAPAMDVDMWHHQSTQDNIDKLVTRGDQMISTEYGELASGLIGLGRMAEPENIVDFLADHFTKRQTWSDRKVLINAGPTYEAIDPVRFIGNRSSGKMGIALAREAEKRGAQVTLVLGPSHVSTQGLQAKVIRVTSAQDMFDGTTGAYKEADVIILAAAVADYTPVVASDVKIKKSGDNLSLDLARTKDIAAWLGKHKKTEQILVGFALETNNAVEYAKKKIDKKNLDLIVLNTLEDKGAGFQGDTNKVTLIYKDLSSADYPLKSKIEVASDILDGIEKIKNNK